MTLWGSRFSEPPDEVTWRFTSDTSDRRLLGDDVRGSLAHVAMLGATGIVPASEAAVLTDGLEQILAEAEAGTFAFAETDEDVHTAVERRLSELVGAAAGMLHTGRSRNDQVCLDLRLYLSRAARDRIGGLHRLVAALADKAEAVGNLVVPAYTHLQQAQAVPLAHHLLAYGWMLLRDAARFADALERIEVSPLGAGAAGGSSLPLDPGAVASAVGFGEAFANSLDAVAARDFAAEYVFCCAQAMVHLSRLSEELVLWSTTEFGWVVYDDRHTTGSSALPQKKNPDVAELARGRAASVIGEMTTILTLQKGLPLAYNRDLQEDKRAVFHADDTLATALGALAGMVAGARFDPPPPSSWVTALDLAEAMVGRGVPFREAHEAVGRVVAALIGEGRTLAEVTAEELTSAHPAFLPQDLDRTTVQSSLLHRRTPGGGSPASVAAQLAEIRRHLD